MTLSYQLYSSRNWPLADTLRLLSEIGYAEVEGYGGVYEDVAGTKALLDETGLRMTSGHFAVADLEADPEGCIALAKALGIARIYAPYLTEEERPGDVAGWEGFAARLAEVRTPVEAAGLTFGWHNHDFELVDLGGGRRPLNIIADAGLNLELDLGWVQVAGLDLVATIEQFAPRITSVHIKDQAPAGQNTDQDGWSDVGAGVIDWAAVHRALSAAGVSHYVIEHDNPADHASFARNSFAFTSSL